MNLDGALGRVRVVLSRTSHPGNIGAAARAMKTMGLSQLVLVDPHSFPDPVATARAAGADDILANARVVGSLAEALEGTVFAAAMTARKREMAVPMMWARQAAGEILVGDYGRFTAQGMYNFPIVDDTLLVGGLVLTGVDDDGVAAAGTHEHPGVGAVERHRTGVALEQAVRVLGDLASGPMTEGSGLLGSSDAHGSSARMAAWPSSRPGSVMALSRAASRSTYWRCRLRRGAVM